MENRGYLDVEKHNLPKELPALIKHISSNEVAGFDSIEHEGVSSIERNNESGNTRHQRVPSVSISMPNSPIRHDLKSPKKVLFEDSGEAAALRDGIPDSSIHTARPGFKEVKFHSQPMPKGRAAFERTVNMPVHASIQRLRDKRYDSFKTWSGKLERQLSHLRGRPMQESPDDSVGQRSEKDAFPVDRYFDALEGPELETLRPSEELVLPDDKTWPFLLRYPISSFGICLGVSSQAIMWKTLATSNSTKFLHISVDVNLVLWCISVALVATVASVYLLKVILYFEAVRREYYHPIRVNFFFAPWIALLFLALGLPPSVAKRLPTPLWYILMAPILCLELKIYGQWMSGGQRRLSKVANPTNHLSIVGNFVGALLGASMGLKEGPIFFFAVGLAHYAVLFVTLYQRLPTNETLPKELHPVFFLFVAAPSVASMAWANIQGSFDHGARIAYFIALFLYFSLAVRVNFFRGFKFSLAWWAYTFPMTGAAVATIRYSNVVTNVLTQVLAVTLSVVATLIVTALLVSTIIHAFVLRNLFPNDIAIAISNRKPKHRHHHHLKWFNLGRENSSDHTNDIENYLKYSSSEDLKDMQDSQNPSKSSEHSV